MPLIKVYKRILNQIWPKINKIILIKFIIKFKIINLYKRLTIRLKIIKQIIKIKIKLFKWLTKKDVKMNKILVKQNKNNKRIPNSKFISKIVHNRK